MKRMWLILGVLAVLAGVLAVTFVLRSEHALVMHPKGTIARQEVSLIGTNYFLMFIIIVPTFIFLLIVAWKYRSSNEKAKHDPEHEHSAFSEMLLWVIPAIVVVVMMMVTWKKTHELDPYRPIESEVPALKIQVVSLDWKWLFIYPEQGIATLNFFQFPAQTPIHFQLVGDGAPMNSFWIPQLSGQIYSMTGMATQLHMMAEEVGEYPGRAAEINGEGLADMTFIAKASTPSEFEEWVSKVKQSENVLTDTVYNALVDRSVNNSVILYSSVENDLFKKIVMKYMASM